MGEKNSHKLKIPQPFISSNGPSPTYVDRRGCGMPLQFFFWVIFYYFFSFIDEVHWDVEILQEGKGEGQESAKNVL